MFRLFLVLLCALAPSAAWSADCPDESTARFGFVLQRLGIRTEVRPASDLFTHALNIYSSGKKQDVLSFRGLISVSRSDEEARYVTIPLSDLRTVFPLEVGTRRAVTVVQADRAKAGPPVSLELAVAGRETLQVGTCTYQVLAIRNRYLLADGKVQSQHTDLYAPALAYVIGRRFEDGGRETNVTYQSIQPLGKTPP